MNNILNNMNNIHESQQFPHKRMMRNQDWSRWIVKNNWIEKRAFAQNLYICLRLRNRFLVASHQLANCNVAF